MSGSPAGRLYNLDCTFVTISGANEIVRVQGERVQVQLANGNLTLTTTAKTSNRERRRIEARNVHQASVDRHHLSLQKLLEAIENLSRDIEVGACNVDVAGQQLTKLLVQKGKLTRRLSELEGTVNLQVAYSEVESGTTVTLTPGIVTATFLGLPVVWCPRPLLAAEQSEEIPVSGPIPTSIQEAKLVIDQTPATPALKTRPPPSPAIFPVNVNESKSPFFAPLSTQQTTSTDLGTSSSTTITSTPSFGLNTGFASFDFTAPASQRQSSTTSEVRGPEDDGDAAELSAADEGECTATFTPVVKLPEQRVDSGEGNEDCIYQQMCLLYRFDPLDGGSWKTRGKGLVKLLQHKVTRHVRIVLREGQTLKVRMNHRVNPLVELKAHGDKAWTWATTDYAEDSPSEETFSIKFQTTEFAKQFKAKHDEARKLSQLAADKKSSQFATEKSPAKTTSVTSAAQNTEPPKAVTAVSKSPVQAPVAAPATSKPAETKHQAENCLYEEKCLMYCYDQVAKKWPTAKTGQVKLLQHANKQVRIIVNDAETKTLCLNHLVNPSTELKPNAGSDKSWTWAAVDFAAKPTGGEQHTFAIKFRTAEQATAFKKKHDEGKAENARGGFEEGAPLGEKPDNKGLGSLSFGVGSSDLGPISSAIFGNSFSTTSSTKDGTSGFSFANTNNTVPFASFGTSSFTTSGTSPFSFSTTTTTSPFSFAATTTTTTTTSTSTGFSFSPNAFSFVAPTSGGKERRESAEPSDEYFAGSGEGGEHGDVEAECTATYAPVVKLAEKKVDSGESEEDVVYQQMSLLYRFDPEEKSWKTRGKGYVKLLQHRKTLKFRVVLREDKTLKVRMNHSVNPQGELKPVAGQDKSWMWSTMDYAEDDPTQQTFSIKFGSVELAKEFKIKHDEARAMNGGTTQAKLLGPFSSSTTTTSAPTTSTTPEPEKAAATSTPAVPAPAVNAFAALKNKTDWTCAVCDVENKQDAAKCASCENPNPNAPTGTAGVAPTGAPQFTFGAPSFSFGTDSTSSPFTFGGPSTSFSFSASTTPFTFGTSTASITFPSADQQKGKQKQEPEEDDAEEGDEGDFVGEGDFADEGDAEEEEEEDGEE